eukprot:12902502-Prorocentrum_lima.AAC.1
METSRVSSHRVLGVEDADGNNMSDAWAQYQSPTTVYLDQGQPLRVPQLDLKYATSDGNYLVVNGPADLRKIIGEE